MNGLEKIVARMEADTRAECDALTASAAENAAAIAATDSAISVAAQRTVFFVSRFFIAFSAI